ncbi:hypothetical protein Ga0074812_115160 [Parafrankia irregularis]|uniref:Uncharacterized protein n=1 Tax=Parafrankia irregularis TaxID=795642 RepID=A0A0S4QU47_9ACTN|nr:hypothetical protein Ga0074812_115160 [Parafrankia irregularis]
MAPDVAGAFGVEPLSCFLPDCLSKGAPEPGWDRQAVRREWPKVTLNHYFT